MKVMGRNQPNHVSKLKELKVVERSNLKFMILGNWTASRLKKEIPVWRSLKLV